MPTLKDAVIVLGVILGCCALISLGAFFAKQLSLGNLAKTSGIIAFIAIILYVIYVAFVIFSK